jgi:hypothetical protein
MKAIIFYGIDNWGDDYKFVVVTENEKVEEVIAETKKMSTEIEDFEVVDCIEK